MKKSRLETLQRDAEKFGFYVATYSPGDGVTRYRFFSEPSDYFGPASGLYTALGYKEATIWLNGAIAGASKEGKRQTA